MEDCYRGNYTFVGDRGLREHWGFLGCEVAEAKIVVIVVQDAAFPYCTGCSWEAFPLEACPCDSDSGDNLGEVDGARTVEAVVAYCWERFGMSDAWVLAAWRADHTGTGADRTVESWGDMA